MRIQYRLFSLVVSAVILAACGSDDNRPPPLISTEDAVREANLPDDISLTYGACDSAGLTDLQLVENRGEELPHQSDRNAYFRRLFYIGRIGAGTLKLEGVLEGQVACLQFKRRSYYDGSFAQDLLSVVDTVYLECVDGRGNSNPKLITYTSEVIDGSRRGKYAEHEC